MGPETRYHRRRPLDAKKSDLDTVEANAKEIVEARRPSKERSDHAQRVIGRGRPSKAQFGLLQTNPTATKSLLGSFWIPWRLMILPIVQFASFAVSWSASLFLTVNLTQAQALAAPPYNFSQASVGMCNFSILAGAVMGLLTASPLSDWLVMRLTL